MTRAVVRELFRQVAGGERPRGARFYGVPAEPWKHVRSTNPVASTFARARLRTSKTKGCRSRETALAMGFRLAKSAERPDRLAEIIRGVRFRDGEPAHDAEAKPPPEPHRPTLTLARLSMLAELAWVRLKPTGLISSSNVWTLTGFAILP